MNLLSPMALLHANGRHRACAECRRLKLRCDRKVPCQSCVRRGCSSICPDKCFTDKATPRSLKETSLRSREHIQLLQARIGALEKALAQENPSHPLIIFQSSPSSLEPPVQSEEALEEATDILGALSITEDGSTIVHGLTGSSEFRTIENLNPPVSHHLTDEQSNLPPNLQLLSALFPFTPRSVALAAQAEDFLPFLPPAAESSKIITRFWSFSINPPITQTQFMKHVYDVVYPDNEVKCDLERADAHRLGLLFITLALGVITDSEKPISSSEAERYYQLSRAALSLDPVCNNTTVHALQCMLSMNWYVRSAPEGLSRCYDWVFHGIILKLASSIGIFQDSRNWLTDPDEIQQREMLCWEIICLELWMAFTHGRLSNVDPALVDCSKPPEASLRSPGSIPGYYHWKYTFYSLINKVLLVVLRPNPVKYSEILALDRQLHECVMPPGLEVPLPGSSSQGMPDDAIILQVQRFIATLIRETTFCVLHRRFLVLALENKSDHFRDAPFRYSVLSAGNSARRIVASHVMMYRRYPKIMSRVRVCWSVGFSAAIILGAISAWYTDPYFAECTFVPFENIRALFAEAVGTSPQALDSLKRLHTRVTARMSPNSAPRSQSSTNDQYPNTTYREPRYPPPNSVRGGSPTGFGNITSGFLPEVRKTNLSTVELFSGNIRPSISKFPNNTDRNVLDPMYATWPSLDPTHAYPSDDSGIHTVSPKGSPYQPWPEGAIPPVDATTMGPSIAEVQHWDQFLDNLSV